MRGFLYGLLGLLIVAAPVFAGVHHVGAPAPAHGDDGGHDGHDHDKDCDEGNDNDDHGDHEDDEQGDQDDQDDDCGGAAGAGTLVVQSALLSGLEGNTLFPFIDVTPHKIVSAHIAITDSTEGCKPELAPPNSIQVLVGVAGGTLVNVMTNATNTGIGDSRQCVFHVTIVAGQGIVPATVTDIVVKNAGEGPLTGVNTITVSAEVL